MVVLLAIMVSTLLHWSVVWDRGPQAAEGEELSIPAVVAWAGTSRGPVSSPPLEIVTSDEVLLVATSEERLLLR